MTLTEEPGVLIDPEELLRHDYRQGPHDPFRHAFVAEGIRDVFSLSEEFESYFPGQYAAEVCSAHLEHTKHVLLRAEVDPGEARRWGRHLRARTLIALERLCHDCRKCELWRNTPDNCARPVTPEGGGLSVFGEGALDPLVMLCAEGPGAYESVTGLPLVGSVELRASHCAQQCDRFEPCYLDGSKFKRYYADPMKDCHFTPLAGKDREKRLALRMARRGPLHTTGELLDGALGEAGLIRAAPHMLRRSLLQVTPDASLPTFIPTNVYCTNAVRHRSVDASGKNAVPTKDQVSACGPWLEMTIRVVRPKVVVALGTPALTSLGPLMDMRGFSITKWCPDDPGAPVRPIKCGLHPKVFACVHPSYIMRSDTDRPGHRYHEKLAQVLSEAKREAESA